LLGAFSFAWLLGLVPGAPGGLLTTAITFESKLFSGSGYHAIALYRLVSILAEAAGAGLAARRKYYKAFSGFVLSSPSSDEGWIKRTARKQQ